MDASHQLSLSPGPQLVSAPSWSQLLPYSSIVGAELLPRSSWRSMVKDIDIKTKVSQCPTDNDKGNRGRERRSKRHSAGIC